MTRVRLRVRVERNRYGSDRDEHPWLVRCDYCAGGDWFGLFTQAAIKGGARTWRVAMDYAVAHAREHEARRCPTCHHVPTGQLPKET